MKTYIRPEIKCIEIMCDGMIAVSISDKDATEDASSKQYSGSFDDDFED